jgi:hypothetical protein
MKLAYICVAAALALGGCDPNRNSGDDSNSSASDSATENSAASDNTVSTQRYTKEEFTRLVMGKTKAEIRAQFGSPGVVHDDDNEWGYFDLPVYDSEAGTKVGTTYIKFYPSLIVEMSDVGKCDSGASECAGEVRYH